MAKRYRLYAAIVTALALCKHCLAARNVTEESANGTVPHCHRHGDRDNCTDTIDTGQWNGHFSKCPEDLVHYCIHGECRYVEDQKAPSCRCLPGYVGSRCEYAALPDWLKGGKREIIIIGAIAALVALIVAIVIIFICAHKRLHWGKAKQRKEPRNGSENVGMTDTSAAHTSLLSDPAESLHTNSV
ncbi:probetacellulin isoform 2-T2 [Pholidichthys leucotaenia]